MRTTPPYTMSVHGSRQGILRSWLQDIADELNGDESLVVVIRREGDVIESDVRHMASRADMHESATAIRDAADDLSE